MTYLNGAVATQAAAEIGRPDDVTFVFGHTHKPFIESRGTTAFSSPISVINTGGWVVDTPQRNPLKGASLVLIDEKLNVASLCCYTEGADASSYRLRIDPANATGPNELVDELRNKWKSAVVVLASVEDSTVSIVSAVTKDLTAKIHAGKLAASLAQAVGGKGGGGADQQRAP